MKSIQSSGKFFSIKNKKMKSYGNVLKYIHVLIFFLTNKRRHTQKKKKKHNTRSLQNAILLVRLRQTSFWIPKGSPLILHCPRSEILQRSCPCLATFRYPPGQRARTQQETHCSHILPSSLCSTCDTHPLPQPCTSLGNSETE